MIILLLLSQTLCEQVNVSSERRLLVNYTKLSVLQSGLIWALLGDWCTLEFGLLLQTVGDYRSSWLHSVLEELGLQCTLGLWAILILGVRAIVSLGEMSIVSRGVWVIVTVEVEFQCKVRKWQNPTF